MSWHREAPEICMDPVANSTYVDALASPDCITLIAKYIPVEGPFGDDVLYEIHGGNDRDVPAQRAAQMCEISEISGCPEMIGGQELAVDCEPPSSKFSLAGMCHACGVALPPVGQGVSGMAIQATVTQPIAAALRLTHLLSPRERTVFQLLGVGYDNRSIASDLGVSERTVKRHVTVILAKLRLESRLQAGLAALIASFSPPQA